MDEVGVQSKHRARQFVTKLWVSDCKGNFHLATCLCDNGSEVNFQSNFFCLTTACLIRLILLPLREFLDILSQVGNAVVIYQLIWSLKTFGKMAMWRKLSLRMTTSLVPT